MQSIVIVGTKNNRVGSDSKANEWETDRPNHLYALQIYWLIHIYLWTGSSCNVLGGTKWSHIYASWNRCSYLILYCSQSMVTKTLFLIVSSGWYITEFFPEYYRFSGGDSCYGVARRFFTSYASRKISYKRFETKNWRFFTSLHQPMFLRLLSMEFLVARSIFQIHWRQWSPIIRNRSSCVERELNKKNHWIVDDFRKQQKDILNKFFCHQFFK